MTSSSFDALVKYFKQPVKKPSSLDVAKFIVLNAATDKPIGPGMLQGGNEPSLMGRIFDVLSRPNYAVAELINSGGSLEGFWKGLTGEKKTTFSDVLENLGMDEGPAKSGLGFALDVGLDPTTYIPGAAVAKGVRALKGTKGATKPLEKSLAQDLLSRGEPVFPESFGLPKSQAKIPEVFKAESPDIKFPRDVLATQAPKIVNKPPGQLELPLENFPKGMPDRTPTAVTSPVEGILPVPNQLPFKFPGFNVNRARQNLVVDKAEDIVTKATQGDPESILRLVPQPKPKINPKEAKAAAEIVAKWNNNKFVANINKKHPETLNAKQQVTLYQQAIDAAKSKFKNPDAPVNKGRIASDAYKIYVAIEKALEAKGLVPRIGTGENVRLSDVIQQLGGHKRSQEVLDEFGSEIKSGSPTWQAVQALRAAGVIDESKTVKDIVEEIQEAKVTTEASNLTSEGFNKQFEQVLKKIGEASAKASSVSPAGIGATGKLIDFVLKTGKSNAQLAVEQKAKILDAVVATGKINNEVTQSVTRALESDLGTLPKWVTGDNKAIEFMMGRIATWWGQKDLRPLSLNAIGSSAATATARGKALDNLFAPYNQGQRSEAMRLAQGIGVASTPEIHQLATQIYRLMDNLVGQVSGSSVLLKAGIPMGMLNKWMKYYKVGFEFTNKSVKDSLGNTIDYSKGTDWLKSWKSADIIEDPKVFLFKAQQAMEQATREKALFEEIGERFGVKVPGKDFRTKISGYPYLEGYYFPSDIAKQIPRVVKDWSIPHWSPNHQAVKLYDRVLSMWKAGVTIYRPGHHVRNMIGDVYLGWMDGVNSLRPYILAARVQRSLQGAYTDLENVDRLVQVGILGKGFGTPKPHEILFRNKSGVAFTAEQIGAVAHQKGLLEHTNTLEDIIDMGEKSRFRPFKGKVQAVARGASELQSHNARLAHFIDKVMKSKGNNLEEIFEQASRRARKWHPSGLDLTDFEKKVMRRIMPFYSWVRKSTPLLLEGLLMNPGKAVIPSKLYDAIQDLQGIDTPGRSDPFPVDQMFPEWIRAQGIGPIGGPESLLGKFSDQMPPGYVMAGVGLNPLSDLMAQAQTPGKTLASSITPAIGVPMELMTGRKTFTGEPISGPDARPGAMEQYIGEQIPGFSAFQGITGITPFGTETKKSLRSSDAGTEALINWLTGLGIRGTGPYTKQAKYEKTSPIKMQRKVQREEFLKKLREIVGEG